MNNAIKRPKELKCDIHRTTVQNNKWIVFVGLMNENPYEIFAGPDKMEFSKKYEFGVIIKNFDKINKSTYDLRLGQDDKIIIKDIVGNFNNLSNATLTRFISLSLRHRRGC